MSDKNIYQRFLEVQKKVTTVLKNDKVEITKNNSYKAVTHDDVAALLHLPLAEAGIVLVPTVTNHTVTTFEVEKKGYNGGANYIQLQYRVDLDINVKWINADNPEEFIESSGGAYAFDTSDKAYAKAYSLALKIVLLKVHLLESRDGEEQRDVEKDIVHTRQNTAPPQKKQYEKLEPENYVLTMGSLKGKKLGEVSLDQLNQVEDYLSNQIKEGKCTEKQKKFYGFVLAQVRAVQKLKEPKVFDESFGESQESLGMNDFAPPPDEPQGDPLKRLQNKWGTQGE